MIIGHVGVALAAKRRWASVPFSALVLATFAPDLLRVPLAAAGLHWKVTNLYTHALPWCIGLAAIAGGVAWLVLKDRRSALVVVAVVVSHLVLDMVSGRKPLWAGGPIGLDVEEVEQLEWLIESLLVFAAWLYLRQTSGRTPAWLCSRLVPAVLVMGQAVHLVGSMSHRPYKTRCIAAPIQPCTDKSFLTRRWETSGFW
ncbi:MAG: hypothetical protein JWM95_1929 [Gemmatimonadetes bacterium]|nr:hypothetical protein [Gemmatimonadota bacterium]